MSRVASQETSARYRAVEPEQWLQRHPEAGSSWPSCPKASYYEGQRKVIAGCTTGRRACFALWGSGIGGLGLGFGILGFGFRVYGLRVQGSGLRVKGSGFRVEGWGLRVEGLGLRV